MPTISSDTAPPKRMTRASAKAAEEKSKKAIVTTPAARAASKIKRKINENGELEGGLAQLAPQPVEQVKSLLPAKSSLKATAVKNDEPECTSQGIEQPKKAGRGRPRKAALPISVASAKVTDPSTTNATRAVRTRATPAIQVPDPKTDAPKRKVTFESPKEDKEHIAEATITSRLNLPKANSENQKIQEGFRAKPIRAPAAARRGKKAQIEDDNTSSNQPLLAKKNLEGEKRAEVGDTILVESTPSEHFNKSPMKLPIACTPAKPTNDRSHIPQSTLATTSQKGAVLESRENNSARDDTTLILQSPAKRPPLSPYKNAMKESPKRLATSTIDTSTDGESKPSELPLLQRSPKKFNVTQDSTGAVFKIPPKPAFKASMFTSPARRPPTRLKGYLGGTPVNPDAAASVMSAMTSLGLPKTPARFMGSSNRTASSSLKVSESPESSTRIHHMSAQEQQKSFQARLGSTPASTSHKPLPTPAKRIAVTAISTPCRPSTASKSSAPPKSIASSTDQSGPAVQDVTVVADVEGCDISQPPMFERDETTTTPSGTPSRPETRFTMIQAPPGPDPFEDESEDELLHGDSRFAVTPLIGRRQPSAPDVFQTPVNTRKDFKAPRVSMTALAERFSQWKGVTPESSAFRQRAEVGSPTDVAATMPLPESPVFDLGNSPEKSLFQVSPSKGDSIVSPIKPSFFEEAFVIREDPIDDTYIGTFDLNEAMFRASQLSAASQDYGDENMPVDPRLMDSNTEIIQTCTPARIFDDRPHVIHTVTKVPLKPSADSDETPSAKSHQRCRSKSSPSAPSSSLDRRALRELPIDLQIIAAVTPSKVLASLPTTPSSISRSESGGYVLKGAVVYVDVHTMEGADASGIFVELLIQMGAKCVKQWTWSPRSSVNEETVGTGGVGPFSRAGITHVVFKDGGKRTMEKVRESGGQVRCVGVNWVLDCERENKWVDETKYAIDASTVPRGEQRRRKSMEPKTLKLSGNATQSQSSSATARPSINAEEFLNLGSPTNDTHMTRTPGQSRQVAFAPSPQPTTPKGPETPTAAARGAYDAPGDADGSCFDSPTTPYFLHPQQLVQQTCPPKQTQQPLFPANDSGANPSADSVRQRLLLARRKSLQFVPRVGSPLARMLG